MNPREKKMAIVIGGLLGLAALYNAGKFVFVEPFNKAKAEVASLKTARTDADGIIRSTNMLAKRWNESVARTFSFDRLDADAKFQQYLLTMLDKHKLKLSGPSSGAPGTKIGDKTGITTVALRISADGKYTDLVAFLRELYESPYLFQVSRLNLRPMGVKQRDLVKIEQMVIETPVMPKIKPTEIIEAAAAKTASELGEPPAGPARGIRDGEALAALSKRNVFRQYVPAPTNVVNIDNQDRLPVSIVVEFTWDDAVEKQPETTVGGKSKQTLSGKGDVAIVRGTYADGKTVGPQRFDATTRVPWTWTIPPHSPPEVVDLAVDNQHDGAIEVMVTVVDETGKSVVKPTMKIPAKTKLDVEIYKATTVTIASVYPSGIPAKSETFRPREGKQVLVVPQEQEMVKGGDPPPIDVSDVPADANLTVTGLLTYPNMHEMIATDVNTRQRKIIYSGEIVDGGKLLGVHPTFGGVVWMPQTGNYYLYLLGKKFTERLLLKARSEEEVPAAIDEAMSATVASAAN